MTKLYFVRHAEPDFSWIDTKSRPLTEEGISDTEKVLEFFKQLEIHDFYSSTYERSINTIASTASHFNKEIIKDTRLIEREAGIDGNQHKLIRKRWQDKEFYEHGGESINMVQARNINAINDILLNHKDKSIVIGTHGTSLGTILNYYDNRFDYDDFIRIFNWMPYIIELRFNGNKFINSYEHLYIEKIFKK